MATLSFKRFERPSFRFAPASCQRMCSHGQLSQGSLSLFLQGTFIRTFNTLRLSQAIWRPIYDPIFVTFGQMCVQCVHSFHPILFFSKVPSFLFKSLEKLEVIQVTLLKMEPIWNLRIYININSAFRMACISLDVVRQNIVVYASTGITLPF